MFNIQSFSMLYTWLMGIYLKKKTVEDDVELITLNPELKKSIYSYCLRVLDQAKLIPLAEFTKDFVKIKEVVVIEVIRIMDVLCLLDSDFVPQIFPHVQRLSTMAMNQLTDRTSGLLFIAVLQFYLNHGELVGFDPDPLFQPFTNYLGTFFHDPIISFEALLFCRKNKKKLLTSTNLFSLYFPPLLKIFAWNPEYNREIKSLIPAFIGPSTYSELFHSILDLPLLTAALVRVASDANESNYDTNIQNRSGPLPLRSGQLPNIENTGRYRVLYNYLLRNESGASVNWWDSAREILDQFCKETVVSSRIESVAEHSVELLDIYFSVLVSYADEKTLLQIVPLMCQRMDQLFPLNNFQKGVRNVLVQQLLAIFERFPSFIVKLRETIVNKISDHNAARENLVLHLCWLIGEYATPTITNLCTPNIINDYDEALELLAFERMAQSASEECGPEGKRYNDTLMSVLISSLAKLAARYTPLVSRVSLCLLKLDRYRPYFSPAVISRMEECINILQVPSVAAAILDARHKTSVSTHHLDSDSSLPFLLQSTGPFIPGQRSLYPF
jgi:AP-5 complex subunit zeta-1